MTSQHKFNKFNHTKLRMENLKTFRIDLAKQLISNYCSCKRIRRPSMTTPIKRFCQQHFPTRGSDKAHWCHYCHNYIHEWHETVAWAIAGKWLSGGEKLLPEWFTPPNAVPLDQLLCNSCQTVINCPVEITPCRKLICRDCSPYTIENQEFNCLFCNLCHSVEQKTFLKCLPSYSDCSKNSSEMPTRKVCKDNPSWQTGRALTEWVYCMHHSGTINSAKIITQPANAPPTVLEQRAAVNVVQRMLSQAAAHYKSVVALPTGGERQQKRDSNWSERPTSL